MGSPGKQRLVVRVVIRIIIFRKIDRKPFSEISLIFSIECHTVILRMSHNKNLTAIVCHCKEQAPASSDSARIVSSFTLRTLLDRHIRMAGMRRIKFIIKAAYERNLPIQHAMLEQTEHLVIQQLLLQAIVIVKPCLRSPAEIDCGRHIASLSSR